MAMRVFVSRCMRFCVFPLGPMMIPMKLYPGYSFRGTKIFRVFFLGLQSAGGRKRCGHLATSHPTSSDRSSSSLPLIRSSRVLVRTPCLSYWGGGDGDLACSGRSSAKYPDRTLSVMSTYLAYILTTSGSSLSAGDGPPSAAPMPYGSPPDFSPWSLAAMLARWALIAACPPCTTASAEPTVGLSSSVFSHRDLRFRGRPSRSPSTGSGAGAGVSL